VDLFTAIALLAHMVAVLILLSTLPRQLSDIWKEQDARYRKICWVIFLGTICLLLTNALQLMMPLFYGGPQERFFNNITSTFNASVAIILGSLAHMMYRNTNKTVPHTIDEIDKKHK
jgi:hypothetical protein